MRGLSLAHGKHCRAGWPGGNTYYINVTVNKLLQWLFDILCAL